MLKVLDLFSGIGGFSLGLERTGGFETIAFCEIEDFPRKVLRKHWPDVPIFEDVRKLHAADLPEAVDLICGGYPCQPFSLAGKREGKEDDRHLWPEIVRLIRELASTTGKPSWCIFENVGGHVSMGLDQVLIDLESEGYTTWPLIIPACALNAPHRRDRVWIIAHHEGGADRAYNAESMQRQKQEPRESHGGKDVADPRGPGPQKRNAAAKPSQEGHLAGGDNAEDVTDTTFELFNGGRPPGQARRDELANGCCDGEQPAEWTTQPPVCAGDDGLPNRVARLKALGNAVIPQIPELIGRAILAA